MQEKQRFVFISWLRVIAMFMVFYPHIVAYTVDNGLSRRFAYYILNPLHIIQFMGAIGVSLFFISSGFLTFRDVATGEYTKRFIKIIKLVVDVFLCVMFIFCILQIFNLFIPDLIQKSTVATFNFSDWVCSAILYRNLVFGNSVDPVLWFLIPFIFFKLLVIFFDYICRGNKELVLIMFFTYFLLSYSSFSYLGLPSWIQPRTYFMCIIILGYIFALAHYNIITYNKCFCYIMITVVIMLFGMYKRGYNIDDGYIVSVVYAAVLFICFYIINSSMNYNLFLKYSDKIGLFFFVFHNNIGKTMVLYLSSFGINKYLTFIFSLIFILVLIEMYRRTVYSISTRIMKI